MRPTSFADAAEFHRWLERNHESTAELLIAFHKKTSGLGGLTYAEALDEALCHGWIDGVRKSVDATTYTIRFTPRRPRSVWSQVNVRHVERLTREGRMRPAGLRAFATRTAERTGVYSFENKRPEKLPRALDAIFRANAAAYAFFQTQPPGYRKTVNWWVVSAKQEETRQRRLARVISVSAAGRRLDLLSPGRPAGAAR